MPKTKCWCGCGRDAVENHDVGGTIYPFCQECLDIHLWANRMAVEMAREQVA